MKFKASHTKVGNSSFCICLFLQSSCWTNTSTANHDGRIAPQVCTVFCSAILVCLLLTCSTPGQTVVDAQQSLPPYGSFSGSNFDIVSLQNGNLHISIPVVSAK